MATRLMSLAALLLTWQIAAHFGDPRLLPGPAAVFATMKAEAMSGALFAALGVTIARVAAAFILAMAIGSAIGYAMGRNAVIDRLADSWIIVLLNLPALVIIVLAYIWAGLNEAAAICAVALNKLPNAVVIIREGARALDAGLDEMASVFRFSRDRPLREAQPHAAEANSCQSARRRRRWNVRRGRQACEWANLQGSSRRQERSNRAQTGACRRARVRAPPKASRKL